MGGAGDYRLSVCKTGKGWWPRLSFALQRDGERLLAASLRRAPYLSSCQLTRGDGAPAGRLVHERGLRGGSFEVEDLSGRTLARLDLPLVMGAARRAPFAMEVEGDERWSLMPATAGEGSPVMDALLDRQLRLSHKGEVAATIAPSPRGAGGRLGELRNLFRAGRERKVGLYRAENDAGTRLDERVIMLTLLFRHHDYEAMRALD